MKILLLCNKAPYPANDGSSIAIYHMAIGLISCQCEVTLLTINTKKHFKPDSEVPENFRKSVHYQSVYQNTNTSIWGAFVNLFTKKSYFVSRFYFPAFSEALEKTLIEEKFDIIQLEGLFMAVYIPLIKQKSNAKIVLRAHNIEHIIWERHIKNEKNVFKKYYLRLQNNRLRNFETQSINQTDAVVCITHTDEHFIKRINSKKPVYTCITGINPEDYILPNKTSNTGKNIFYFGAMDWMPNVEAAEWFLENCWKQISKKHPDCILVIAGRNMPESIKKYKNKQISIIENVENKNDFYANHDIMLVPLLSGSGLRIKIIEGMAFGKAIVSTSIGAEGIKTQNGKEIILADTPQEFIDSVCCLLENEDKKITIANAAKNFAQENFNLKKVSEKLISFYKETFNFD